MISVKDIEKAIDSELDGGKFEELVEDLVRLELFNKNVLNFEHVGMSVGKSRTCKSKEDIWVRYIENGIEKNLFVAVSSQKKGLFGDKGKINADIEKLLGYKHKNNCKNAELLIVVNKTVSFENRSSFLSKCKEYDCAFEIWGIDTISFKLNKQYPILLNKYLNISFTEGSLLTIEDYIKKKQLDNNFDNAFMFRKNETELILQKLNHNKVVIIYGKSGCGKTRLALEIGKELRKSSFDSYVLTMSNYSSIDDLKRVSSVNCNVLVIADDANKFKNVLDLVEFAKSKNNLYLILTIRDYVVNDIKEKLDNDFVPDMFVEINSLTNEQITEIIKKNYNISNPNALKYVLSVAKGNLRFTILTANSLISSGKEFESIAEVIDNYCHKILKDIGKDDDYDFWRFLTAMSFFEKFDLRDSDKLTNICNTFIINQDDFWLYVSIAEQYELVTLLFGKQALKCESQIMAEYLFYKIIFEYRQVNLIEIYNNFYKTNDESFRRMIQSLVFVYNRNELVSKACKELFNFLIKNNRNEEAVEFACTYGPIFSTEAIDFLKNYLYTYSGVIDDSKEFRYHTPLYLKTIRTIFYNFETDEYYLDVVDFIFDLMKTNGELKKTVLYAVNQYLSVKRITFIRDYKSQLYLIKKAINNGYDFDVYSTLIKTYYPFSSEEYDGVSDKSITFYRLTQRNTPHYSAFREAIYILIETVMLNDDFNKVNDLLNGNRYLSSDNYDLRKVDIIYALKILNKIEIKTFKQKMNALALLYPFLKMEDVKKYLALIYDGFTMLLYKKYLDETTSNHLYGDNLNKSLLSDFESHPLEECLDSLVELEINCGEKYGWKIYYLLNAFFTLINIQDKNKYNHYFKKYLHATNDDQIQLIEIFNMSNNKKELLDYVQNNKNLINNSNILAPLYLSFKKDELNDEICESCFNFFTSELFIKKSIRRGNESICSLLEYELYANGFLHKLLSEYKKLDRLFDHFLSCLFLDAEYDQLINMFGGDVELVVETYFAQLERDSTCDIHASFANRILELNSGYLKRIVKIMIENKSDFRVIENFYRHPDFIDTFIDYMDEQHFLSLNYPVSHVIERFPEDIYLFFLENFINRHSCDYDKMFSLSVIVQTRNSYDRLLFLKSCIYGKVPASILKKIIIMRGPNSWSGDLSKYLKEDLLLLEKYIKEEDYPDIYRATLKDIFNNLKNSLESEEIFEFNRD